MIKIFLNIFLYPILFFIMSLVSLFKSEYYIALISIVFTLLLTIVQMLYQLNEK